MARRPVDLRPVLAGPVIRAEVLVAVHIEDRDDDEDGMIEPTREALADGHIAHQHQDGVLAFDLAGVNAALDHDDDLVGPGRGFAA